MGDTLLAVLGVGVAMAVVVGYAIQNRRAMEARLRQNEIEARKLGLELVRDCALQGQFEGFEVMVSPSTKTNSDKVTMTLVRFELVPGLGLGLHVVPRTFIGGDLFRWATDSKDLPTGDKDFDKAFVVHAKERGALLEVLGSRARQLMLDFKARQAEVKLTDERLEVIFEGNPPLSEMRVRKLLKDVLALALALTRD